LASCLLAAFVSAQSATVTPYGTPCNPTLSWTGLPRPGEAVTFIYSGRRDYGDIHGISYFSNRPVFLMGVSDQSFGGVPLPILLPLWLTNNTPGCTLLVSLEVMIAMGWEVPGRSYLDRTSVSIPNDGALLGVSFFAQWMHWYQYRDGSGQVFAHFTMSGAARATIGT
jgi:hypothetical protein